MVDESKDFDNNGGEPENKSPFKVAEKPIGFFGGISLICKSIVGGLAVGLVMATFIPGAILGTLGCWITGNKPDRFTFHMAPFFGTVAWALAALGIPAFRGVEGKALEIQFRESNTPIVEKVEYKNGYYDVPKEFAGVLENYRKSSNSKEHYREGFTKFLEREMKDRQEFNFSYHDAATKEVREHKISKNDFLSALRRPRYIAPRGFASVIAEEKQDKLQISDIAAGYDR